MFVFSFCTFYLHIFEKCSGRSQRPFFGRPGSPGGARLDARRRLGGAGGSHRVAGRFLVLTQSLKVLKSNYYTATAFPCFPAEPPRRSKNERSKTETVKKRNGRKQEIAKI